MNTVLFVNATIDFSENLFSSYYYFTCLRISRCNDVDCDLWCSPMLVPAGSGWDDVRVYYSNFTFVALFRLSRLLVTKKHHSLSI